MKQTNWMRKTTSRGNNTGFKPNKTFGTKLLISQIIVLIVLSFSACKEKEERPTTSIDTARLFIESSLNGDFKTAESLLLKNPSNQDWYKTFEVYYQKLSPNEKEKYKHTNYQINSLKEVNDSLCMINFSNDYLNKPMEMKLIKRENEWMVDFSYSYENNKMLQ